MSLEVFFYIIFRVSVYFFPLYVPLFSTRKLDFRFYVPYKDGVRDSVEARSGRHASFLFFQTFFHLDR